MVFQERWCTVENEKWLALDTHGQNLYMMEPPASKRKQYERTIKCHSHTERPSSGWRMSAEQASKKKQTT
jgi:hypothetical protein